MTMYLVFSAFTSRPISPLAATKASVFSLYSMYASAQYVNIISVIPNNMNKKINMPFSNFCSAGSTIQFVTNDSQTSYHNLSFRFLSLYSFNFLLYQGGLLSTSRINFSMSSTTDIAVWLKTQGLCTLLQLASNSLVASARGQTETRASYRYQQLFCCLENGSGRITQQLFCCRNRKVASARARV